MGSFFQTPGEGTSRTLPCGNEHVGMLEGSSDETGLAESCRWAGNRSGRPDRSDEPDLGSPSWALVAWGVKTSGLHAENV
jgi:hypothetical protein